MWSGNGDFGRRSLRSDACNFVGKSFGEPECTILVPGIIASGSLLGSRCIKLSDFALKSNASDLIEVGFYKPDCPVSS